MNSIFKTIASASLFLAATASANAAVTIGAASGGNCFPFSCGYSGTYQQVYSGSSFGTPTTITGIDFFTNLYPGTYNTAKYALRFFYTGKSVDGLSQNYALNRTTLLADFGTFNLSGAAQPTLSFTATPFLYDPSLGNLLLDIRVSNLTASGSSYQDMATASNDAMSRVYGSNNGNGTADTWGLVTRFNTAATPAVPEPATWAMMLVGFAAIGGAMRGRKRQHPNVRFAF